MKGNMNDNAKQLAKDKEFRRAVENALITMGREYRNSGTFSLSSVNIEKMKQFQKSISVMKAVANENDNLVLEVEEKDPYINAGSLSLSGNKIVFSNPREVARAFSEASNINVYINDDGVPQVDMVFYGITEDL